MDQGISVVSCMRSWKVRPNVFAPNDLAIARGKLGCLTPSFLCTTPIEQSGIKKSNKKAPLLLLGFCAAACYSENQVPQRWS